MAVTLGPVDTAATKYIAGSKRPGFMKFDKLKAVLGKKGGKVGGKR